MFAKIVLSAAALSLIACASSQKESKVTTAEAVKPAVMAAPTQTVAPVAKAQPSTAKQILAKKEKSETKAAPEAGSCASGKDKRSLEVKKGEKGGCELLYSKNGEATKVAEQSNGTNICEEVQEKIKTKLIDAGFTCS